MDMSTLKVNEMKNTLTELIFHFAKKKSVINEQIMFCVEDLLGFLRLMFGVTSNQQTSGSPVTWPQLISSHTFHLTQSDCVVLSSQQLKRSADTSAGCLMVIIISSLLSAT